MAEGDKHEKREQTEPEEQKAAVLPASVAISLLTGRGENKSDQDPATSEQ
jgi:hypothetical protein